MKMSLNCGNLARNEQMDRRFMFMEKNSGVLFATFIRIHVYPSSQVSVYRIMDQLVLIFAPKHRL